MRVIVVLIGLLGVVSSAASETKPEPSEPRIGPSMIAYAPPAAAEPSETEPEPSAIKTGVNFVFGVARLDGETGAGLGVDVELGLQRGAWGGAVAYEQLTLTRDGEDPTGATDHAFALRLRRRLHASTMQTLWVDVGLAQHVVTGSGEPHWHGGSEIGISNRIEPKLGGTRMPIGFVVCLRAFATTPYASQEEAFARTTTMQPIPSGAAQADFGIVFQMGLIGGT